MISNTLITKTRPAVNSALNSETYSGDTAIAAGEVILQESSIIVASKDVGGVSVDTQCGTNQGFGIIKQIKFTEQAPSGAPLLADLRIYFGKKTFGGLLSNATFALGSNAFDEIYYYDIAASSAKTILTSNGIYLATDVNIRFQTEGTRSLYYVIVNNGTSKTYLNGTVLDCEIIVELE